MEPVFWVAIAVAIIVVIIWATTRRLTGSRRCAICSRYQESWPLWSVERGNNNVVCDACINKTVIVGDLRKRIVELEAQVKEGRDEVS